MKQFCPKGYMVVLSTLLIHRGHNKLVSRPNHLYDTLSQRRNAEFYIQLGVSRLSPFHESKPLDYEGTSASRRN